jgi:hypothetical protein
MASPAFQAARLRSHPRPRTVSPSTPRVPSIGALGCFGTADLTRPEFEDEDDGAGPTRRHADTPTRRHADTPTRRHADELVLRILPKVALSKMPVQGSIRAR